MSFQLTVSLVWVIAYLVAGIILAELVTRSERRRKPLEVNNQQAYIPIVMLWIVLLPVATIAVVLAALWSKRR